jgi:hypothetical protein
MSLFEQTVLPLFEEHRADWLQAARAVAARIGRDGRGVTIDDVRAQIPPPRHIDPRVMGAVFLRRDWEKVGYQSSIRTTCHKRPVATFRLRSAAR